MRATMMVGREWLAERRRLGVDGKDEVWDGVLHVAPTPTTDHQRFESALEAVLRPVALARGTERPVELAIEILSPDDETRDKLPFYAERGVITRAPALDLELSLAGTKLRVGWTSGSAEI